MGSIYFRILKILVRLQRVTVVKVRVNSRSGDSIGCFVIKVNSDDANNNNNNTNNNNNDDDDDDDVLSFLAFVLTLVIFTAEINNPVQ